MMFCFIYAKRKGFSGTERLPLKVVASHVWQAVPSLALIFIVMGGIISGIFTPTEAGAIAVLYALVLSAGIYREVDMSKFGEILSKTVETTAIVLFLIATSSALS